MQLISQIIYRWTCSAKPLTAHLSSGRGKRNQLIIIIGHAGFWCLSFKVRHKLINRPNSLLVKIIVILSWWHWYFTEPKQVFAWLRTHAGYWTHWIFVSSWSTIRFDRKCQHMDTAGWLPAWCNQITIGGFQLWFLIQWWRVDVEGIYAADTS